MVKHSRDVGLLAGLVYFTQGALGITGVALPLFLRDLNWKVSEITTVASLAAIPWTLKIIYGLLSDCFPLFGFRRKSYLMVFACISALGWLSLILLPPEKHWILLSLLLANLGFAATDVITDGFIVEHSRGLSSHLYQSIAWGTRSLGAIVSGVTGGWLAEHWQNKNVFLIAVFLPLPVILVAYHILEKKMERGPFHSAIEPLKRCLKILFLPNLRWFILLLFIVTLSSSFGVPFFFYMKETLGFKETLLGGLVSLGWLGAVIASLLYGKWLSKISPKLILRAAILINCINILSTLLIQDARSAFVIIFIGGMMSCITILPIMSVSAMLTHHSGVEGSLFAILMSIFNLGQICFGFFGGKLYPFTGLYPLIWVTGIVSLGGLWVVAKLDFNPIPRTADEKG
ncbi:MAG TPA: MFS transporter [bacterium]|nr:MFS transporter [bacterium]